MTLLFFIYKKFFNKDKEEKIFKDAFDNLQFETGKAIIKDFSKPYLDELANVLNSVNWSLTIIGHTDNVGSEADNLILSKKRADAVKAYFISQKIDGNSIVSLGRGKTKPVTGDTCKGNVATPKLIACLAPDRRAVIEIIGTK